MQQIFRIDQAGQVTARLPKLHELVDAEGIATNKKGDFVILSEDARSIFTLTSNADAQAQRPKLLEINGTDNLLAALDGQADRPSPEGLAIERSTDAVFVANERDPRLLIELSPSLGEILSVTMLSADIGLAATRHPFGPLAIARVSSIDGFTIHNRLAREELNVCCSLLG